MALNERNMRCLKTQYYPTDYRSIGGNNIFILNHAGSVGLYNGNISALTTDYADINNGTLLKSFRYDKLNRIRSMETTTLTGSNWGALTQNYATAYTYDPNGNFLTLSRKQENGQILGAYQTYNYSADNNRLGSVDIGVAVLEQEYDKTGNFTASPLEQIFVEWNSAGKIKNVNVQWQNHGLEFYYNPTGQRLGREKDWGGSMRDLDIYIRDAAGNVMAIYNHITLNGVMEDSLRLIEQPIYGSQRLGVFKPQNMGISYNTSAPVYTQNPTRASGQRYYELTDHLGNVTCVIRDSKVAVSDPLGLYPVAYYKHQYEVYNDYYPFGVNMRTGFFGNSLYRFGFNGQEREQTLGGMGSYSFEFRTLNIQWGRWLSIDLLSGQFPWVSPYAFVENDVIRKKDIGGKYGSDGHYWTVYAMGVMIGLTNDDAIKWREKQKLMITGQ